MSVSNESLTLAGETRSFVLASPSSYDATKTYPLVLVLHGDGGDGAAMRAAMTFDDVSRDAAFVAYPSGHDRTWNLYEPTATNTDFAFLSAVVTTVRARFAIDRVFGIGFSSGAFMLNQIACREPAFFNAIVPHSGGAPDEPRDPSASRWPNGYTRCHDQTLGNGPATLAIHGTADRTVAFDSGDFESTYWGFINNCTTQRSNTTPSPCVVQDGCPSGKTVGLCPVANLGHAIWPAAASTAWTFFNEQ